MRRRCCAWLPVTMTLQTLARFSNIILSQHLTQVSPEDTVVEGRRDSRGAVRAFTLACL